MAQSCRILLLVAAVSIIQAETFKNGDCPQQNTQEISEGQQRCSSDSDCPDNLKCCAISSEKYCLSPAANPSVGSNKLHLEHDQREPKKTTAKIPLHRRGMLASLGRSQRKIMSASSMKPVLIFGRKPAIKGRQSDNDLKDRQVSLPYDPFIPFPSYQSFPSYEPFLSYSPFPPYPQIQSFPLEPLPPIRAMAPDEPTVMEEEVMEAVTPPEVMPVEENGLLVTEETVLPVEPVLLGEPILPLQPVNLLIEEFGGHPGLCPPLFVSIVGPSIQCSIDFNCPMYYKCCLTINGRQCIRAMRNPAEPLPRPGRCPRPAGPRIPGRWTDRCVFDNECGLFDKCCLTPFGTRCTTPNGVIVDFRELIRYYTPGNCPSLTVENAVATDNLCNGDDECPTGWKCCAGRYGRQCMLPVRPT